MIDVVLAFLGGTQFIFSFALVATGVRDDRPGTVVSGSISFGVAVAILSLAWS